MKKDGIFSIIFFSKISFLVYIYTNVSSYLHHIFIQLMYQKIIMIIASLLICYIKKVDTHMCRPMRLWLWLSVVEYYHSSRSSLKKKRELLPGFLLLLRISFCIKLYLYNYLN